jgi:hypothetical protein
MAGREGADKLTIKIAISGTLRDTNLPKKDKKILAKDR